MSLPIEQLREAEALAQRELEAAQQLVRETRVQLRAQLDEEEKLLRERERAFAERRRAMEESIRLDEKQLDKERRELRRQIDAVDALLHPPNDCPNREEGY